MHFHGDWLHLLSLRVATKCIGYKPVMAFPDDFKRSGGISGFMRNLEFLIWSLQQAYVYTIQLGNMQ